jgi:hypothetical protein
VDCLITRSSESDELSVGLVCQPAASMMTERMLRLGLLLPALSWLLVGGDSGYQLAAMQSRGWLMPPTGYALLTSKRFVRPVLLSFESDELLVGHIDADKDDARLGLLFLPFRCSCCCWASVGLFFSLITGVMPGVILVSLEAYKRYLTFG